MWLVERQRSGGVQRAQPRRIVATTGSDRRNRRRATTPRWRRGRWPAARPSLRLISPARPEASTTQRAASVASRLACSNVDRMRRDRLSPKSIAAHHGAVVERPRPSARACSPEEVLEAAAIELPRRRRQQLADAEFGAAVDVVAAFGEEEAETELADLLGLQMLAEAEHVGEVVRADLDRRFADLERGFAHRMRAALEHRDVDARDRAASAGSRGVSPARPPPRMTTSVRGCVHAACPVGVGAGSANAVPNSPLGSSITGGLARMLRYTAGRPPSPQTHCQHDVAGDAPRGRAAA